MDKHGRQDLHRHGRGLGHRAGMRHRLMSAGAHIVGADLASLPGHDSRQVAWEWSFCRDRRHREASVADLVRDGHLLCPGASTAS